MKFDYNRYIASKKVTLGSHIDLWAIGDVHGCKREYDLLIDKIYEVSENPCIVQLGDMIDRGPSFDDLILEDRAHYKCMGNHEINFLLESSGFKKCRSLSRNVSHEKFNILDDQRKRDVLNRIKQRSKYYIFSQCERTVVFSHAPHSRLEKNSLSNLFKDSSISDWAMRSSSVDYSKLDMGKVTFVYGHQSWDYNDILEQNEIQRNKDTKVFNLDSNCVYGECLTAFCLNDNKVIQVKSTFDCRNVEVTI